MRRSRAQALVLVYGPRTDGPIRTDRPTPTDQTASGRGKPARPAYQRNRSDISAKCRLTSADNPTESRRLPQSAAIMGTSAPGTARTGAGPFPLGALP
jgi:hypothetical protein